MTAVQRVGLRSLGAWNFLGEDERWRSESQEGGYRSFPPTVRRADLLVVANHQGDDAITVDLTALG